MRTTLLGDLLRLLATVSVLGGAACDDGATPSAPTTPGSTQPGSTQPSTSKPASDAEVRDCLGACQKLKFFGCADADTLATCYSGCDAADEGRAVFFVGCVETDTCDPSCLPYLLGKDAPAPDPVVTGSGDTSGGGNTDQAWTDPGTTTTTNDATMQCAQLCGSLVIGGCVTGALEPLCESTCIAATSDQRQAFSACALAHGDACADACIQGLGIAAPSSGASDFDITVCETRCDTMHTFDCIDAADLSECRGLCRESTAASVSDFIGCAEGICNDRSCLTVFEQAP